MGCKYCLTKSSTKFFTFLNAYGIIATYERSAFMTVGEKIQYYRKSIGLSQEELGQKILVSRQTVSLWEMDKTLPTVDNLLRLKEAFSVSIDDILSEAEPITENTNEPKEAYVFKYEKRDLRALFKAQRMPLIKRAIACAIICVVLLFMFAPISDSTAVIGLILGCLFFGEISYIRRYLAFAKGWRRSESRVLKNTYSYEIFDGYFMLNVSRNEEIIKTQKVYFDDVERTQLYGNYIFMHIAGQVYIIKKDAIAPVSVFKALGKNSHKNAELKKPQDKSSRNSMLLFVLSICSPWCALFSVAIATGITGIMGENMWIFFLFLPIPIASVIYGYHLKRKGFKYKKNVIAGFIIAPLLFIYGSFSFIFADTYSHSDEPILNAEKTLNIDIPEHSGINTKDWTQGEQSVLRGYIYYTSDIYFEESVAEEFEKSLPTDARWITDIPSDMIGITSSLCDIQRGDYYLIYNKDTGEFNQLPKETGTYELINIVYDAEENLMELIEYRIEYTKSEGYMIT